VDIFLTTTTAIVATVRQTVDIFLATTTAIVTTFRQTVDIFLTTTNCNRSHRSPDGGHFPRYYQLQK
jgi:hypothetical protein